MGAPIGQGIWIAYDNMADGGDPDQIAAKCVLSGIGWVAPRVNSQTEVRWLTDAAPVFRREGLGIYPWEYAYPHHELEYVNRASECIDAIGCDGFILDCETEFETDPAAAQPLVEKFRKLLPDVWVAHAPFAFPLYHPAFPYAVLGKLDAVLPQLYWTLFNASGFAANFHQYKTQWDVFLAAHPTHTRNIWPIAPTYGKGAPVDHPLGDLTRDDCDAFLREFAGIPFSWYTYERGEKSFWEAISGMIA